MKLLQVLIILLFVVLADGVQPKKCFNNVAGYCRKKCRIREVSEVGCRHGKYCCVNELENQKQKIAEQPIQHNEKPKGIQDYFTLPTITYFTITI